MPVFVTQTRHHITFEGIRAPVPGWPTVADPGSDFQLFSATCISKESVLYTVSYWVREIAGGGVVDSIPSVHAFFHCASC